MTDPTTRIVRRLHQGRRVLQAEGARGLAQRVVRAGYQRLDAGRAEFPLLPGDVADSQHLVAPAPVSRPARSTPLTVGWVMAPPAPGSGGHTTTFRLVEGLERAGHTCVVYLYDRYQGDIRAQEAVIRRHWPAVRGEVRTVRDGFRPTDALIATGWPTAHAVAAHAHGPTRRMYFVQDFEPYFYPRGSEYALVEDTYRFGFRTFTIGRMLAELLRTEMGVDAASLEFGCDTDLYRLVNRGRRDGVVFYAKPDVARRGFELGSLALEELHRRHPEVEIHTFGDESASFRFPTTNHGVLSPTELGALYNHCVAGLTLSFTNISLIPDEMLACGTIPVINDLTFSRGELSNPHIRWAFPTPGALADALSQAVEAPDQVERAEAAATAALTGPQWKAAQDEALALIEDEVYGPNGDV